MHTKEISRLTSAHFRVQASSRGLTGVGRVSYFGEGLIAIQNLFITQVNDSTSFSREVRGTRVLVVGKVLGGMDGMEASWKG